MSSISRAAAVDSLTRRAISRRSLFSKPTMPGAVSERIPVAISWESIKSIVLSGDHCGTEPLPRTAVKKKIWAYIKKHKLQNSKNKREILADD